MLARTFPLLERPPVPLPSKPHSSDTPTLWIAKPKDEGVLSADTECLKWQAYLALSQKAPIAIRTDISPSGALENKLPNLFLPATSTLLPAHHIPSFVEDTRPFDGYPSKAEQTESLAWISLLEGTVHAALLLSQKANESYLAKLLDLGTGGKETPVEALLTPSPAPLTGFASILPANMGTRINIEAVIAQYREAIASLSDRLDTDKWFLGSEGPTALDALAFAYLHTILDCNVSSLRIEVTKRVNLVAWEFRVRQLVREAFVQMQHH